MEGLYQTIRHKVYQNLDVGHDITDDELYQVIDRCIYEASEGKNNINKAKGGIKKQII